MGVYYNAVVSKDGNFPKKFSAYMVNNGAELMEHSYVGNGYVERIMAMFLRSGTDEGNGDYQSLVWLCDYHKKGENQCDFEWDDGIIKDGELTYADAMLNTDDSGYFILNMSKKCLIDIGKMYTLWLKVFPDEMELVIHPIPILCNSDTLPMGGGDYYKEDPRRGVWCNDSFLVVTDKSALENMGVEVDTFRDVTEDVLFFEDEDINYGDAKEQGKALMGEARE